MKLKNVLIILPLWVLASGGCGWMGGWLLGGLVSENLYPPAREYLIADPSTRERLVAAITPAAAEAQTSCAVIGAAPPRLDWTTADKNIDTFEIERSINGGSFVALPPVKGDVFSYVDLGAVDGATPMTYIYRIRAVRGGLKGPYAPTGCKTIPVLPPVAPVLTVS